MRTNRTSGPKTASEKPKPNTEQPEFVNLAPTDEADASGVYSRALNFAIADADVSNIALTGPYGSGKSSIIRSFLRGYIGEPLEISLAAFLPEATSSKVEVSKQEIERSILQQMLYGAEANNLPLSRFKRIRSPGKWSFLDSLFILIGLLACWHLALERDAIASGSFFEVTGWIGTLNWSALVAAGAFLWRAIHHFYVASFGISLKSISLKDIEIAPEAQSQESILNRHLDEIIYFFQSTTYDLVIIEDLDRFNNPDVFVRV